MRLPVAMGDGGDVECCCQATATASRQLVRFPAAHSAFDRRENGDALPSSLSSPGHFATEISRRPRKVTDTVRSLNCASAFCRPRIRLLSPLSQPSPTASLALKPADFILRLLQSTSR